MKYRFPTLPGSYIDGRAFPEYVWNADLIYYDGPFLSLFRQEGGGDSLFFWLDTDGRKHRWGVVDIDRIQLAAYLDGELTLRNILKPAPHIYVFETTPKGRRTNIKKLTPAGLPASYWPAEKSFLTERIATDEALALRQETAKRYELKLSGEDIYIEDLGAIPRLYEQLYSFIYGLAHIGRPAVREKITSAVRDWTGGFAAVNLFNGLKTVIPSVHKVRVSDLHYASPGQIGMQLLPKMAVRIADSVEKLDGGGAGMDLLYRSCYAYFRAEKLSGFEEGQERKGDTLTHTQAIKIDEYVAAFVEGMGLEEFAGAFSELQIDSLGQLRALLAYYRRLRKLRSYVDRNVLRIPKRAAARPSVS